MILFQEKSVLSLNHTIQFLGCIVDSALMVISVADITKADRPNVSHNAGSITGNIVLSKSAKDKKSGAQPLPFIQGNGNIG